MSSRLPEISVAEKWDHSVENLVRKTATGFAAGVGFALLCRTSIGRATAIFVGGGLGAGIAYGEARYLFDYDIVFDRRSVVSVDFYPPAAAAPAAPAAGAPPKAPPGAPATSKK